MCTRAVWYEWIAPPSSSHITISPAVASLEAGASSRVELRFTPTLIESKTDEELLPSHVGHTSLSQDIRSSEPFSQHSRWTIPLFYRTTAPTAAESKEEAEPGK